MDRQDSAATRLLSWSRTHAPALRRDIETLVSRESPSTDKAAVDRCGAEVIRILGEAGATITTFPQHARGDHVRAEFPGSGRRVLILGHFDTVWDVGQLERMPLHERDGRLLGPGMFDMKAGLAVAVHAIAALRACELPMPTVVMLFTTDEEIGSRTSRTLIEAEARASHAVLVLEPSLRGGAVKTARKGCGEFTLTAHGVSAHAGIDPGSGASAIHELARQIVALQALSDPATGVSVNVGIIHGGTRGNVVAEQAQAIVDVRVPTAAAAARVETAVRQLVPLNANVRLEISGGVDRPPLERTAGVLSLYEHARAVARELGEDLGEGSTGGGSDGNFTAALGVPTLDGLGPEGDGAHALHEHVLIDRLPWRVALVAGLLHRLSAGE